MLDPGNHVHNSQLDATDGLALAPLPKRKAFLAPHNSIRRRTDPVLGLGSTLRRLHFRRRTSWVGWVAWTALASAVTPLVQQVWPIREALAEPEASSYADAVARLVRDLERVAAWAADNRLAGGKHRAMRRILVVKPDHPRARATLGFTRDRQGKWVASATYREPPDWNKDAIGTFDQHLQRALGTFRNDVLVAMEEGRTGSGRELDVLAELLPDDPAVRSARGEEKLAGRWVPTDMVRSIARQRELADLARRARNEAPPVVPTRGLDTPGLSDGFRAGSLTVAGTADAEVLRAVADDGRAVPHFLELLLHRTPAARTPVMVVIFRSAAEAKRLFVELGEANDWKRFEALGVGGAWVGETARFVVWNGGGEASRRLAMRGVLQWHALRAFGHRNRGWIYEGVERLLLFHFAGFPGPPTVANEYTGAPGAAPTETELPSSGDWLPSTAATVQSADVAKLTALLTMRLGALSPSDARLAYALAAFVFEAMPERVGEFIDASVASDDAAAAVSTGLGLDVPTLLSRLRRWVEAATTAK